MDLKSKATELITRNGREVTLRRPGEETRNEYGEIVTGPPTDYPVTVATARYDDELVALGGGILAVGDLRLMMVNDGTVEPDISDEILMDGKTFDVRRVTPIQTDGEAYFYDLQIRDF